MTTTKLNLNAILDEAFASAAKTAADWLQKYGDRDACGFAWVNIKPARGPLITALKKHPEARIHKNYEGGGIRVYNPSRNNTQSISPKEDGAQAFIDVLKKYGVTEGYSVWAGSRLD